MRHYSAVIVILSMLLCALLTSQSAAESPSALANLDGTGLALEGYDPISYHTGQPRKGEAIISATLNGARYLFSSEENKTTFAAHPEKYVPAFGGWCAWAMLDGEKIPVDPERYKIVEGKTYLFYNSFFTDTLKKWNKLAAQESETVLAERARKQWYQLQGR